MSQYGAPPPTGAGERWSVNMPAVIGVVFVFLVGVIVWVVARSGGGDDTASPDPTSSSAVAVDVTPDVDSTTVTTTPAPMPDLTEVPATSTTPSSSVPVRTAPVTTAPATTAPGAEDGAVAGDLAIAGRPMQQPPCDGGYITILASAVGAQASAAGIAQVLETYPGSEYLRTDQTCPSLRPSVDGEPIYVVYLGPFAVDTDACSARAEGPDGAYVRRLSTELDPGHGITCARPAPATDPDRVPAGVRLEGEAIARWGVETGARASGGV